MPIPPPVVAAGIQALSQGVNAAAQGSMNRKQRKWSEKMYERQRSDSLMDWAMQNNYNSPEEQMKRLKEAGLNPNLVYGSGAETTAGVIRSSNVESWRPQAPQVDMSFLQGALGQMYDIELKKAQTDNVRAATEVAGQDAILRMLQQLETQVRTAKTAQEKERAEFDLEQARSLMPLSIEQAKANLRKTQTDTQVSLNADERAAAMNAQTLRESVERVLNLRAQRAKTGDERAEIQQRIKNLGKDELLKQYEINMRALGIQPGDKLWERMLQNILDTMLDTKHLDDFKRGVEGY